MSTFYRIAMKPNYKYVKTVANAFHISSALLESGEGSKLFVTVNGEKFEVAALTRDAPKKRLDLNFSQGDQLIFHVVGQGEINLEGYLLSRNRSEANGDDGYENDTDDDDDDDDDDGNENDDEETDDSGLPDLLCSFPIQQNGAEGSVVNPPPMKRRRMTLQMDEDEDEEEMEVKVDTEGAAAPAAPTPADHDA